MYIIGIDIGTGSTKAIAMDEKGDILISAQVPYPTISLSPGMSEQDPELIWQAFQKCVARITATLSVKPEGIALSSAMHSLICADDSGNVLSNMITWADNRSAEYANKLKTSALGKKLYSETGTPIHAMSPLCKLMWLKDSNPELYSRAGKFISIKEYIWFKLFGVFEVDFSIASATGLFNIVNYEWHVEALEVVGLSKDRLSKAVDTNFLRTGIEISAATSLGVSPSTKVVIGGSDGCLANVGSAAVEPGIAALTIGTSGAIRVAGRSPVIDAECMPFNYLLDRRTYISGGPINNGGVALKWYSQSLLKQTLESDTDYEKLLKDIDAVPAGCDGLVFLPYILGERAPIWNSESCGVFFGITARHKQEHFTRAVIEGITFSLYQIARSLMAGGLEINEVHVSGGFVRSETWVQILANIFGKRIRLMNVEDASAIGAAMIAMQAFGVTMSPRFEDAAVFDPDMETHQVYVERYFPMYESIYRALVLEMKILHDNRTESLETISQSK